MFPSLSKTSLSSSLTELSILLWSELFTVRSKQAGSIEIPVNHSPLLQDNEIETVEVSQHVGIHDGHTQPTLLEFQGDQQGKEVSLPPF